MVATTTKDMTMKDLKQPLLKKFSRLLVLQWKTGVKSKVRQLRISLTLIQLTVVLVPTKDLFSNMQMDLGLYSVNLELVHQELLFDFTWRNLAQI